MPRRLPRSSECRPWEGDVRVTRFHCHVLLSAGDNSFVTESAGRPFKTHDDAEAHLLVAKGVEGQSTNRDKGSEGQSSRAFSSGWYGLSHQAALRPRGRRPRPGWAAVSSQRPPAWLETWAVSRLCLLQTIGPGSRVGPDSAVSCVSSRLAGGGLGTRVCEPVNPSPARRNFP